VPVRILGVNRRGTRLVISLLDEVAVVRHVNVGWCVVCLLCTLGLLVRVKISFSVFVSVFRPAGGPRERRMYPPCGPRDDRPGDRR
jgi:hypothetical protein